MDNKVIKVGKVGSAQGDVMLLRIPKLPKGAKLRKGKNANVLAWGEVTGHNHVIEGAEVYELEGQLFAKVGKVAVLTHGGSNPDVDFDHFRQEYQEGLYVYIPKVAYDGEQERRVMD